MHVYSNKLLIFVVLSQGNEITIRSIKQETNFTGNRFMNILILDTLFMQISELICCLSRKSYENFIKVSIQDVLNTRSRINSP